MSDFDRFSRGYMMAAIEDAQGISRVRFPSAIEIDDATSERMRSDAARFFDSHRRTIQSLLKRGFPSWEKAGELFYLSRTYETADFFKKRPGKTDRALDESEKLASRLDDASEKMKPFRLKADPSGRLTGTWG